MLSGKTATLPTQAVFTAVACDQERSSATQGTKTFPCFAFFRKQPLLPENEVCGTEGRNGIIASQGLIVGGRKIREQQKDTVYKE